MSLPAGVVRGIATTAQMRDAVIYWSALSIVALLLLGIYLLLRSRYGLALTAIRDSEPASASLGVDNYRIKLIVYVATAAGTGLVGALVFLSKLRISPDAAFSVNDWTAFVIFIVVIGGVGRIEGPVLGTALFFLLRELFADLGSWYLILLGVIAVAIMLEAPHGVWGLLADRYGLQLFPLQRRVHLIDRSRTIKGGSPMYFVVFATDRPGGEGVRAANRPRHREYLRDPGEHQVRVRVGGPTLSDDSSRMNGTMLVVEAEGLDAVQAFLADDPYARAGLFESMIIRPWSWGLGRPGGA